MSFAKNQEEEVASVPGVTYTDTTSRNDDNLHIHTPSATHSHYGTDGTRSDARGGVQEPTMDVEMGWMGDSRGSRREKSSSEYVEDDEGENAAFV